MTVHEGHRQRMRERFCREGLDGFADHEVLELLLFDCIPNGNVNPLAHDLLDAFGPNRPMALCRELTKDYEQIRRGPIDEIRQSVIDDPPRGEMVLVIGGASNEEAEAAAPSTLSVDDMAVLSIDRALEDGLRIKDAIAQVVQEHPLADGSLANRKQVYAAVLKIKG